MADEPDPDLDSVDDDDAGPAWDALDVMGDRARATRAARDDAVADLREAATDEAIRDEFGIDLREIEG